MRYLIFMTYLIVSLSSFGDEGDYNYGIEGGINLSNIQYSPSSDVNDRVGIAAGLFWEFFPDKVVSFVPGGFVVGKGYRPDSSSTVVLNYFQLRAIGRVSLHRTLRTKFYFDLGPSADVITQKGTQNFSNPPKLTNFRDFDASLLGGLGFETDISGTTRLAFNIKYHYGLLNIINDGSSSAHSSGILFTTAVQFSTQSEKVISTEERARDYINNKNVTP